MISTVEKKKIKKASKKAHKKTTKKTSQKKGGKVAASKKKTATGQEGAAARDSKAAASRTKYDKPHRLVEFDILRNSKVPMKARDISDIMVSEKQISGKTPVATVGRDLCMNPELFAKVDRGLYVAIENENGKTYAVLDGGKIRTPLDIYKKKFKGNGKKKSTTKPKKGAKA